MTLGVFCSSQTHLISYDDGDTCHHQLRMNEAAGVLRWLDRHHIVASRRLSACRCRTFASFVTPPC